MSIKLKKVSIIILATVIFFGLMLTGIYLSGNIKNVFGLFIDDEDTTARTLTTQQTEATTQRTKTDKPEKIRGVWFTAGIDYLVNTSDTADMIKTEIDTSIKDIAVLGFNTIMLDYSHVNESRLLKSVGSSTVFDYCLEIARKNNLFIVVRLPAEDFISVNNDFKVNETAFLIFCKKFNIDAIIISNISKVEESAINLSSEIRLSKTIAAIKQFSHNAYKADKSLLFCAQLDADNPVMIDLVSFIFNDSVNSFIFVEPAVSHTDIDTPYIKLLTKWNEVATKADGRCVFGQRADLLFSDDNWKDLNEIIIQSTEAEKLESCNGITFRSYSVLKRDEQGIGTAYKDYLNNLNNSVKPIEFEINNHKGADITTNESKFSFTGSCSPLYPLTCNSKAIKLTKAGNFSIEYNLKVGENSFSFKQNGKSYNYNVTYKVQLLKSISPKGTLSAPGGTEIEITAIALKNSNVYATVNSKQIAMKPGDYLDYGEEQNSLETDSDFVTYYGKFIFPASKTSEQNLGNIKVYAKYNGLVENLKGAKAVVSSKLPATTAPAATTISPTTTKAQTTEKPSTSATSYTSTNLSTFTSSQNSTTNPVTATQTPATTAVVQEKQLTPYSYAGVSGTSRMCEINLDYCETMPISPLNDYSYPLTTPLLKGMFDYITGESSYDEFLYYNLASGRRVYRDEVKLIEKGYNLPSNSIKVINSSTNGDTNINLALTWKVPINTEIKGQKYTQTYNNRDFGVWSFTGSCIEFTFYYTSGAQGNVNVSDSNVIKSAEWIKNSSNNTVVLRLNFDKTGVYYGYKISYNSDGSLNISIKNKPSNELEGHTIMLDAGHGGDDAGAICSSTSPSTMKYEKQINLALTKKIQERLLAKGATVIMTRTDDSNPTLENRRKSIYDKNPDLSLSIHCDSVNSASSMGTSAYYYYAQSFPLADAIHKQIVSCYTNDIYAGNTGLTDKVDRHSVFFPFRFTRVEPCPSVLLEYGFVSNLNECIQLQKDVNQNKLADATVQGIIDYINAN